MKTSRTGYKLDERIARGDKGAWYLNNSYGMAEGSAIYKGWTHPIVDVQANKTYRSHVSYSYHNKGHLAEIRRIVV